ncbi:cupredoxin domain-containing protein [Parafrigoribacterium mesophilum]|uniref:cupredoxin domain-containing protein n=1 Tax=Parafrigoribacterium mesophilum TaxID=433646 RepID=UPI0031FBFDAA
MTRSGLVLAMAGCLILSGCSGTSSGPDGTPDPAVTVYITDFAYTVPGAVAPGATLTVVNSDADAHTVTSDAVGDFDVTVAGKSQATFTAPMKPGSYPFYCAFHRYMRATLVVR